MNDGKYSSHNSNNMIYDTGNPTAVGSSLQTVIRHSLHPQHQLEYSNSVGKYGYYVYGCDACERKGEGFRYCCKECNFDLHKECALQVGSCTITSNTTHFQTVIRHSLHPQHQLEYSNRGGKHTYGHYVYGCDACAKKGEGFRYCCKECNFDLHKECAAAVPVGSSSMTLQTSARKDKMTKYDDDVPYARIFKKAFIKGVEEQLQEEIKDEIKKHFHEDTIGDVVSDIFQGLFM